DALAQHRNPERGSNIAQLPSLQKVEVGVGLDIVNVDDLALEQGASGHVAAFRRYRQIFDRFHELGRETVRLGTKEHSIFLSGDGGTVCITEAGGRFDQRVQHRLKIEGRAADHLEDVGGGGLLLQGFAQLV